MNCLSIINLNCLHEQNIICGVLHRICMKVVKTCIVIGLKYKRKHKPVFWVVPIELVGYNGLQFVNGKRLLSHVRDTLSRLVLRRLSIVHRTHDTTQTREYHIHEVSQHQGLCKGESNRQEPDDL